MPQHGDPRTRVGRRAWGLCDHRPLHRHACRAGRGRGDELPIFSPQPDAQGGRDVPVDIVDIKNRLELEMANGREYGVEYWPIFKLGNDEFMGCCGLRPHQGEAKYEVGVHLLPEFWGQGYACEALRTVARYAFASLGAGRLFAGHNPHNVASKRLLAKVGFTCVGDEFYEPTGLYHPSYELRLPCAVTVLGAPLALIACTCGGVRRRDLRDLLERGRHAAACRSPGRGPRPPRRT